LDVGDTLRDLLPVLFFCLLLSVGCADEGNNVLYRSLDTGTGEDAQTPLDASVPADVVSEDSRRVTDVPWDSPEFFPGDALADIQSPDLAPELTDASWNDALETVAFDTAPADLVDLSDLAPEVIDPASLIIPCDTIEDCQLTGICLADGTGDSWCLPWCETDSDCPPLYTCATPNGVEDTACLPQQAATQCKPCAVDADCLTEDYDVAVSCSLLGDGGSFCTRWCSPELGATCPFGFACTSMDEAGEEVFRCLPKEGKKCFCADYMEGLETDCTFSNYWGVCLGSRSCQDGSLTACDAAIPVPEECNGLDDDCDGQVDEDLGAIGLTCLRDFDMGTCEFDMFCANGQWNCPEATFLGICDANPNSCFWFGTVIDTDGDFDPDFCDADDDNDGFADDDDCEPTDPDSYPGGEEVCDGIDNDCNGISDYNQLGLNSCNSDGAWGTCVGKGFCIDGKWQCQPPPPSPDYCPQPEDNCTWLPVPGQLDFDADQIPDFCDIDDDGDDVPDDEDNCLLLFNPNQFDLDDDGEGDPCDDDDDGDGAFDQLDCCPYLYNPNQLDTDSDGTCDACDSDDDNDGLLDPEDNCPYTPNPLQENNDKDSKGDACDLDDDNDEVLDKVDNCPFDANLFQDDFDQDDKGDVCDDDDDGDGVLDLEDNCHFAANTNQLDQDDDNIGDICDDDIDGDGIDNAQDNCLLTSNADQANSDDDSLGDACDPDMDNDGDNNSLDNCPLTPNPLQEDLDKDCPPTPYPAGVSCGDACDSDLDGDGHGNDGDNCPDVFNPGQEDLNQDGLGDACTSDKDGDGVDDDIDNCPKTANADQLNSDNDALGDACDADDDNDLVFDNDDNCPTVPNPDQEDLNNNGIGDACEG
jgi:hypothetical protein